MRSKVSLGSSREVVQGCGVSFANFLYLVPIIIGQIFCTATMNQTGPWLPAKATCPVLGFSSGSPGYLDGSVQSRYVGGRRNDGRQPIVAVCYPTYRTRLQLC